MNNTSTNTAPKIHPFEAAGMGVGPYRFVGIFDLAEAREHSMHHGGTHTIEYPKVRAGMGTCANCGMAISVICIVRDANGDQWGVGSDCVAKTDDAALGSAAKVEVARRTARIRRQREAARAAARQEAFLNTVLPSGETNRERIAREQAERDAAFAAQQAAEAAKTAVREELFSDVLPTLRDSDSDFFRSMGEQLARGPLTQRQAAYAAKAFARMGSRQWEALVDRFTA